MASTPMHLLVLAELQRKQQDKDNHAISWINHALFLLHEYTGVISPEIFWVAVGYNCHHKAFKKVKMSVCAKWK